MTFNNGAITNDIPLYMINYYDEEFYRHNISSTDLIVYINNYAGLQRSYHWRFYNEDKFVEKYPNKFFDKIKDFINTTPIMDVWATKLIDENKYAFPDTPVLNIPPSGERSIKFDIDLQSFFHFPVHYSNYSLIVRRCIINCDELQELISYSLSKTIQYVAYFVNGMNDEIKSQISLDENNIVIDFDGKPDRRDWKIYYVNKDTNLIPITSWNKSEYFINTLIQFINEDLFIYSLYLSASPYTLSIDKNRPIIINNKRLGEHNELTYKKIVIDKPYTTVHWTDGTKTSVKHNLTNDRPFSAAEGVKLAACKKLYGDKFTELFKEIDKRTSYNIY